MAKTAKRKRPGRPKGSTAKEYQIVESVPPRCPKCGGTDRKVVPGSKPIVRDISGSINGQPYTRVKWQRYQCSCGQRLQVRSYLS